MLKSKLHEETIDGKKYWFDKEIKITKPEQNKAFLLSIYDEYTIAYNDRTALAPNREIEKMFTTGSFINAIIIYEGKLIGTWKRTTKKNTVEIKLNPFKKMNETENEALRKEVHAYGKFLGLAAKLV